MKSLSILQTELSVLKDELKKLNDTLKIVGSSLQPQMIISVADKEKEIKDKEAEIREAKRGQQDERKEEKEEEDESVKWASFQTAAKVYEETNMCFHRNTSPTYFYKHVYQDKDAKTGELMSPTFELLTFSAGSLSENWMDLSNKTSLRLFKDMVHGKAITVKHPETGVLETYEFEPRVFTKLGNTRNIPDPSTYNMIDLSGIMRPTKKEKECPAIIHQLLLALTGNQEIINDDGSITLTKQENYDWYCKWLYGVLVADIGNNQLSMPVHYGYGKIGRNAMYDKIFTRVLGETLVFTGLWDNLEGNFNGFKLGKVFVFLDEVPPREDWSKLKNLTGGLTELIKKKYGPEFVVENTISMAIGTNHKQYPLPLEEGKQMNRVSPIKAVKESLFAENVYRLFERQTPGALAALLTSQGLDVSGIIDNPFELGDKFLRTNNDMWCSEDTVQQFLNFLHNKFGDEKYTLSPLRGTDWKEIESTRPDPTKELADFIIEHNPDAISASEIYESYLVLVEDKDNKFKKKQQSVIADISQELLETGYVKKQRCRIRLSNGLMDRELDNQKHPGESIVFHKPSIEPTNHENDFKRYITVEQILGKTIRRLKYKEID